MPHTVDTFVGRRIRNRRREIGMSQAELATAVGIKFQQIQKYETGANRVSASRLWDIASAVGVPVTFFFDGVPRSDVPPPAEDVRFPSDFYESRELGQLVTAYRNIPEKQRQKLMELARALAA
ncbi:helix-turn-helix domain-containing protein [Parasulfitobacter algicola]|uniref:Helix-turn-helix transcriptional regulator n=1 Tax=Parasulfitobacter algicola TaxID=2614809 RepID=A0ABX2J0T0_9RHOB|nr:helix-turn-helix transcriptional regulator [Sulfitobacter algicola]